ncbi:unannotated protein [freshwater metagenome]|uniref:Unannotated protein n=1 Tax=freshwater metagenome TaxID=449393 RepID=A0A6J5YJP2_9ZZZZ
MLARQVAALTASLRTLGLHKPPGVSETIDWLRAMAVLDQIELDPDAVSASLGAVVKYREDAERVRNAGLAELVAEARAR